MRRPDATHDTPRTNRELHRSGKAAAKKRPFQMAGVILDKNSPFFRARSHSESC